MNLNSKKAKCHLRRFSYLVGGILALVGTWLVWVNSAESRIVRLEEAVWFGEDEKSINDVERLTGVGYRFLPSKLQARRYGLLGDWYFSRWKFEEAKANYRAEFTINSALNESGYILNAIPDSSNKMLMQLGWDDVEISQKDPIDTSIFTARIDPISNSDNAYYAFMKLPMFSGYEQLRSEPVMVVDGSIIIARKFVEQNRDTIREWEAVAEKYTQMRTPFGKTDFVRMDIYINAQFCNFRIAMMEGDAQVAIKDLIKIYKALNIVESDGGLIYSLMAIGTRRRLLEGLGEMSFSPEMLSCMVDVIERFQTNPNLLLSRIAPWEFFTDYWKVAEGNYLEQFEFKNKGGRERWVQEYERAIYEKWRILDEHLLGERNDIGGLRCYEHLEVDQYRYGRRAFYWREPHSKLKNSLEARTLFTEVTIRNSAEIAAKVGIPDSSKIREAALALVVLERELIGSLREAALVAPHSGKN